MKKICAIVLAAVMLLSAVFRRRAEEQRTNVGRDVRNGDAFGRGKHEGAADGTGRAGRRDRYLGLCRGRGADQDRLRAIHCEASAGRSGA